MGGNGSKESAADKSRQLALKTSKRNILEQVSYRAAGGFHNAVVYVDPNLLEPPREWIEQLGYTLVVEDKDGSRWWTISWKEPPQRAVWEKEAPN